MPHRNRPFSVSFVLAAFTTVVLAVPACANVLTFTQTITPNRFTSGQSSVDLISYTIESPPFDCSPPGTSLTLLNYTVTSTSQQYNAFADVPFTLSFRFKDYTTSVPDNTATVVFNGRVGGRVNQFQDSIDIRLSGPPERSFLIGGTVFTLWDFQYTLPPIVGDFNSPGAISAQMFESDAGHTDLAAAAAPVRSSPTVVDGVAYFGADDGRVYAVNAADGTAIPGFPTETALAGNILSRAAVYIGGGTKNVYLTTDQGYVAKIGGSGQILWSVQPLGDDSTSHSTPAVTPDGTVYVGITNAEGSRVVSLSDEDGRTLMPSALLGGPGSAISSPAVSGNRVFVGLTQGSAGDIAVLDGTTLTVLSAGVAAGEGVTAPPFVKESDMYVGTLGQNASGAGRFYKLNSATAAEDQAFGLPGTPGSVEIGEPIAASAFPNPADGTPEGVFYAGSTMGKVWRIDAQTGAHSVFYDSEDATEIAGLVINEPGGVLAFGTTTGSFYQVPLANSSAASAFVGLGPIRTAPSFDRANNRFVVGADDNHVYSFPVQ